MKFYFTGTMNGHRAMLIADTREALQHLLCAMSPEPERIRKELFPLIDILPKGMEAWLRDK